MQTNIDISRAFMETPDGVLSIHQISKKLKLPYGTAYNRIHILSDLGIVQILPQGKAKLCALNPENPMTASLLALGAAQRTDHFIRQNPETGLLLKKIRQSLQAICLDTLATAILLTPETLATICAGSHADLPHPADFDGDSALSLDFFYITSGREMDSTLVETTIATLLPPNFPVKISNMTLDRNTLLGMFTENENEAGLAAYSMLHEGMLLFGFENFYTLILEAFARKLTV